jgi:hypothetical protein
MIWYRSVGLLAETCGLYLAIGNSNTDVCPGAIHCCYCYYCYSHHNSLPPLLQAPRNPKCPRDNTHHAWCRQRQLRASCASWTPTPGKLIFMVPLQHIIPQSSSSNPLVMRSVYLIMATAYLSIACHEIRISDHGNCIPEYSICTCYDGHLHISS